MNTVEIITAPEGPNTLASRMDQFMTVRQVARTPATLKQQRRVFDDMLKWWGSKPFRLETYAAYVNYLHSEGYAVTTITMIRQQMRCFFGWCLTMGWVQKNFDKCVSPSPKPQRVPDQRKFVSEAEYRQLLTMKNEAARWLCILGYASGARLGDACMMEFSQIDWPNMVIKWAQRKLASRGQGAAMTPIIPGSDLHIALLKLQADHDAAPPRPGEDFSHKWVCPHAAMLYQSGQSLATTFTRRWMRLAGVSKSFHNFRTTLCTRLISSGCSTVTAMSITGHTSADILARYALPNVKAATEAIDVAMRASIGINDLPPKPVTPMPLP